MREHRFLVISAASLWSHRQCHRLLIAMFAGAAALLTAAAAFSGVPATCFATTSGYATAEQTPLEINLHPQADARAPAEPAARPEVDGVQVVCVA
jgi:hypothetical protein